MFNDFCAFATAQIKSTDIDPVYPVLSAYYDLRGLSAAQRYWFTTLYVAFYHLGSTERAFERYPNPGLIAAPFSYPTGIERRGFRGNDKAAEFVNDVLKAAEGDIQGWVSEQRSWSAVRQALSRVRYAGSWSSYKWADLMKHVHGLPITADDIGVGGGGETAGPIPGMVKLTGLPWQVCASDTMAQRNLLKRSLEAGVPFDGLDQMETALCDFNSLTKGTYYVGHDIDQMMKQIAPNSLFWEARKAAILHPYLGELQGWQGVRKELLPLYRDKGEIYAAH